MEGTGRLKEPGKLKHPIARAFARDVGAACLSLLDRSRHNDCSLRAVERNGMEDRPHYSRDGLIVLTVLHAAASGDYQPMRTLLPRQPRRAPGRQLGRLADLRSVAVEVRRRALP